MLERLRSQRRWQWAVYGKNPAAKDCFTLGDDFPILSTFSGWIENGHQVLASKDTPLAASHSWRFWAKESRKENIVCGILRDSNDNLGRPYPLLIIGTGPLKGWVSQWDLMPLACNSAWERMEDISTKKFRDLRELEEEVRNLKPASAHWLELARKRETFTELASSRLGDIEVTASKLTEETEYFIPIPHAKSQGHLELISLYHSFMRARVEAPPNAIFIGGTSSKPHMAVFRRPLAPSDFIHLWSYTSSIDRQEY